MEAFVSKYVREQKRYTKNDLRALFCFSEEEIQTFIRRLKAYGVMKAVKNTPLQKDLSDLADEDLAVTDDATEGNAFFYVFTFVGVLTVGNRVIKCYPKYITQNPEPMEEMKQTIKVLQRYGSKEQIINMYNGNGQNSSFNLLAVMLFLLDDFHQHGFYINSEDIVELNGEGPILWNQTIDNGFAIISNNRPYYVDLYTHRSVDDENDFFYHLHKCVVTECSNQLRDAGILDLFDMVEADISDETRSNLGDDDYILYRLQSELNIQYNTHKQVLLKTMYAYIAHRRTLADNVGISMYGTTSFNLVWEDVCKEVFGDCLNIQLRNLKLPNGIAEGYHPTDQLINIIERPKWQGYRENGQPFEKEAADTLIPDIIALTDLDGIHSFIILDAKYYCVQLEPNKMLRGQPGIGDVTKQYLYQLAYKQFIEDHGIEDIKNCFLMPTEQDSIIKKGTARLNMLEQLNLQNIQIRLLPAKKMFRYYLAKQKMNIAELQL